jgi:hypothetical protein
MEDIKPALDTAGAARYLGMSRSCLEKLRVYGGGPRYMKLRRLVRYRPEDLQAWASARLVSSTSQNISSDSGDAK